MRVKIQGSRGQSINGEKPIHSVQTIPAPHHSCGKTQDCLEGVGPSSLKGRVGRLARRPQKESPDEQDCTKSGGEAES